MLRVVCDWHTKTAPNTGIDVCLSVCVCVCVCVGMLSTSVLSNLQVARAMEGDFGRSQLVSRGRISTPLGGRPEEEPEDAKVSTVHIDLVRELVWSVRWLPTFSG